MTLARLDFSTMLREALQRENITQAALAQRLRKDASTISFWATGRQKPRLDDAQTLKRLTEFLKLDSQSELLALLNDQPIRGRRRKPVSADEFGEKATALAERYDRPDQVGLLRQLQDQGYEVDTASFSEWFQAWRENRANSLLADRRGSVTLSPSAEEEQAEWQVHLHRDAPKVRDRIRSICQVLNHAHSRRAEFNPTLEEAFALVNKSLEGASAEVTKPLLKAIMDHISKLGLAVWDNGRFVLRWQISADYVLNSLFGFKSGVRRLDDLFDGGLLPAINGGLVAILKGDYGRGKSTLALEIAASHANQKQVVFYISTEENPALILERLSYIGYLTRETRSDHILVRYEDEDPEHSRQFIVATSNFINSESVKSLSERASADGTDGLGLLLVVSLPPPFAALMDEADEISYQLSKTREILKDRFTTLVVDSLDAVSEDRQRTVFERFFESQRLPKSFSIFVCNNDSTIKDFLADIVIRLDVRPRWGGVSERTLEIVKCRTQNHRRGAHALTIDAHEGISVFPAIPTVLATWKKKLPLPLMDKELSWHVDARLNLDPLLQSGFLEGHTVLLYGQPGTRKLPLALSFLAAGIFDHQHQNQHRDNWHGAIITLIEDEQRILKVAESYTQLTELMTEGGLFRSEYISVFDEPPDHFFPERFFDRIRRNVEQWKKKGLKRVVLKGLGTLIAQSPNSSYESSLLHGILTMFRKDRISTLLVEPSPEVKGGYDLREIVDVVLHSQLKEHQVVLKVERSVTGNSSDEDMDIERSLEGNGLLLHTKLNERA